MPYTNLKIYSPLFSDLPSGLTYVPFYKREDPNYIFANFWPTKLVINGVTYPTPEHAFQALKIITLQTHPDVPKDARESQALKDGLAAVIKASSPEEARKTAAKAIQGPDGIDPNIFPGFPGFWRKEKHKVFMKVLRARCEQDPDFKAALLATGDAYILEDTFEGPPGHLDKPDIFNGTGPDGMGMNQLGQALMQMRAELRIEKKLDDEEYLYAFEELRKKAQQERRELDTRVGGADKTKDKKFEELSKLALTAKLKPEEAKPPEKKAEDKKDEDKKAPEKKADAAEEDKKKPEADSVVQPKKEDQKLFTNGNVDFLSDKNIGKIKAQLDPKDWDIEHKEKSADKKYLSVENKATKHKFTVHPNKFKTQDNDPDIFVAILKSFRDIHGKKTLPTITAPFETRANWEAACEKAGYNKNEISKMIKLTSGKKEEDREEMRHRI